MAPTALRIRKFSLQKAQLATLSAAERDLFFLSGHILNELNSLNKVFSWCLRSGGDSETQTSRLAQGIQSMIYARVLAGKLWEAWEALRATWFSSKPAPAFVQGLHPDAQASLSALKGYFSRSNLIFNVRNSFAFHYSAEKLSAHWEEVAHGDGLHIVLGGTIGNNIDLGAELITNAALFRAAHPTDLAVGMQTFLDDVQSMASHFTNFLEGVTLVLLRKTLGDDFRNQGTEEEIIVNQSFSQVRIPYFCAPDENTGA
jgi:hypothetical protein